MASSSPSVPAASSVTPRSGRRRQRSVRVTVAVVLLGAATAAVLAALPTQSPLWLSVASVAAYRSLFSERASEHAEFTTAMTDRLVRRDRDVTELEDAVVAAEQRAIEAEARVAREARRANEAQDLVTELTERVEELEIREAEQADELATWHSDHDVALPVHA